MVTDNSIAERAEERRDMRRSLQGLEAQDMQEIVFRETSPPRPMVSVWSMKDGSEKRIPRHMLDATLAKTDREGRFLFTGYRDRAPEYKPGTIKCFLHPEAEERETLDELGLRDKRCSAGNLASMYAKRLHAQNRHASEWAMYQEALTKQENDEWKRRQEEQTAAMLQLAQGAAGTAAKRGRAAAVADDAGE